MNQVLFALEVLNLVAIAAETGHQLAEEIDWGRRKMQQFIDEGREPTQQEWGELNAKTDALRQALHTD